MPEPSFRPLESIIGNSTIRVEYSDITTLNVDVIVSSDDIDLSMGGGVSEALMRAGGEAIWREAQSWAPIELGSIAITTAGRLNAKRIFHAAVLDYARRELTTIDLIRKVTKKCLIVCNELGFQSIAFPALATGVAQLSPERSAVAMIIETAAHLSSQTNIKLVIMALYSRPGLRRDILSRFYSQVADFLELTQRVDSVTTALDNLERVYRELKFDEAANITALSRESLRRRRARWEEEMLEREPADFRRERGWREYREEMGSDLDRISSLGRRREEVDKIRTQRSQSETWARLDREYREYRTAALREMVAIRKRNITDLERELAARGFAVEINRQLEREREELRRLEDELRELTKGERL